MQAIFITDDLLYAGRLIWLINKSSLLPYKFSVLEAKKLDESPNLLSKADLLIWDMDIEDLYKQYKKLPALPESLLLSSVRYVREEDTENGLNGEYIIYKYQSYQSIQRSILNYLGKHKHTDISKFNTDTKLISIYSPVGRCGKSLFSMYLAKLLGKMYRVLLISFDIYPNRCFAQAKENELLSDFLYSYAKGDLNISEFNKSVDNTDGIHVISSPKHYDDIYALSTEEYYTLFEQLKSRLDYNFILLDMSVPGLKLKKLMDISYKLIVPFIDEEEAKFKLESFKIEFERYVREERSDTFCDIEYINFNKDLKLIAREFTERSGLQAGL